MAKYKEPKKQETHAAGANCSSAGRYQYTQGGGVGGTSQEDTGCVTEMQ